MSLGIPRRSTDHQRNTPRDGRKECAQLENENLRSEECVVSCLVVFVVASASVRGALNPVATTPRKVVTRSKSKAGGALVTPEIRLQARQGRTFHLIVKEEDAVGPEEGNLLGVPRAPLEKPHELLGQSLDLFGEIPNKFVVSVHEVQHRVVSHQRFVVFNHGLQQNVQTQPVPLFFDRFAPPGSSRQRQPCLLLPLTCRLLTSPRLFSILNPHCCCTSRLRSWQRRRGGGGRRRRRE
mmetsp:Transcript_44929/g.88629  ORF Transcript_44929/g.88629 Transcript_44929/m.88629 type:complete len:238 (+) Transcript_44929:102-815(+)